VRWHVRKREGPGVCPLCASSSDASENNYELQFGSFAIDKGNPAFIINGLTDKDIKDKNRIILFHLIWFLRKAVI